MSRFSEEAEEAEQTLAKRELTDNANDDIVPPLKKTRTSRQRDQYHAGVSHSIVGGNSNSNFMALGNHNSQVIVQGNGPISCYPPSSRPPIHPRLEKEVSSNAFYNSGQRADPPKCHPNTRLAILETIREWICGNRGNEKKLSVMWLHGPAGSGKTAIAQTIAEEIHDPQGPGLASYFFGRLDATRDHPDSLISTIAYQMASRLSRLPQVRDAIYRVIEDDPHIFSRDLVTQIKSLIVDPLQPLIDSDFFVHQDSKRVVIIDGLDECVDRDGQVRILQAISSMFQKHRFPLLFLICSRPEIDIAHQFDTSFLREISIRLALDNDYRTYEDIRVFLSDELETIKTTHRFRHLIPSDWPTEDTMQFLVHRSSGQFIYASTVIKFLKPLRRNPIEQLEIVLGLTPLTGDQPFAELDALYRHVFQSAEKPDMVLRILSLKLLSIFEVESSESGPKINNVHRHRPLRSIEEILCLRPGTAEQILCDLVSIMHVKRGYLKFYHASIPDFLFDRTRSQEFHLDPLVEHPKLAHIFFQYHRNLRENQFERKIPPLISEGSYDISRWFNLKVLAYHILQAPPNEDLEKDILDFDFTRFFRFAFAKDTVWSIPIYLESIKHSQLDNATRLYNSQREVFHAYIRSQEILYYSNPYLLMLLVITKSSDNATNGIKIAAQAFFDQQDADSLRMYELLDQDDFHLLLCREYRDALKEVLRLPISAQHYASAALYYLKIIKHQYATDSRLPTAKGSEFISGRLRDTPWKYSSKARRLKVAMAREEQRIEVTLIETYLRLNPNQEDYHQPVDRQLLSFFLEQAGWLEELIDYALHFTFNLNWVRSDVLEMMEFKRIIDSYLTRMSILQDAERLSHDPEGRFSDTTEPITYRPELELYLPGTGVALPDVDIDFFTELPSRSAKSYRPFPRQIAAQDLWSRALFRNWIAIKGHAVRRFGTKWIHLLVPRTSRDQYIPTKRRHFDEAVILLR